MKRRVLVVDDDAAMCDVLREMLAEHGLEVEATTDPEAALARIGAAELDAVVADLRMPGRDGLSLCRAALELRPELPVVLVTAFGSMEAAVGAIRAGAWDFLTKPLDPDELGHTVTRAAEVGGLRREVRALRREVAGAGRLDELLGESAAMRELFWLTERVAAQDVTVLLRGETGTGKELVARALHRRSARADRPFVAVNCAAVPEALLESELFGHVRGAFTDARAPRRGLLLEADGGTLFLDEVGELPLLLQPKLLRALQERRVRPVGADREQPFDVRVLAATNRDLRAGTEPGHFRADLYYRLAVVEIEVPPLRARGNDVLLLAQHFLQQAAARMRSGARELSPEAAALLLAWPWPGNVRELQNAIERAVALCHGPRLEPRDLPPALREARGADAAPLAEALPTLEEVERRHVLRALEAAGGSKARAARLLGVDRATLYRKLERWGQG